MSAIFYTFPISLFAMPLPEKEIVDHIESYAIERAGDGGRADEIEDDQIQEAVESKGTGGYNRTEPHKRIMRGMIILGFSKGHLDAELRRCNAARKFINSQEAAHDGLPLVFISNEIFNLYPDNLSFRELSTLCGINSVIGLHRTRVPVIIRRSLIQARQLGYKSPAVMKAELATAKNKVPLTVQQLRDVLDTLEIRKLITRCQPKPRSRTVYFSTGLDAKELRDAVKKITEARRTVKQNRLADWNHFKNQSGTSGEPVKEEHGKTSKNGTSKREAEKGTSGEPVENQWRTSGEPVENQMRNQNRNQNRNQ